MTDHDLRVQIAWFHYKCLPLDAYGEMLHSEWCLAHRKEKS